MGLSSNTRLLTITARLTSNEYESQQITNAKLRLATQSQQASDDYIHALNQQEYAFVTYDSSGNTVYAPLTANSLYQYNDSKNQFVLSNVSGQALVGTEDSRHFEASGNLQQFLESYGIIETFIDDSKMPATAPSGNPSNLGELAYLVNDYMEANGKTKWENWLESKMDPSDTDYTTWLANKEQALTDYTITRNEFNDMILEQELEGIYTREEIEAKKDELNAYYEQFQEYVSFGNYIEYNSILRDASGNAQLDSEGKVQFTGPYKNEVEEYNQYKDNLGKYNAMLEKLKVEPQEAYTYEDSTRAQWYTNLWYRMNGASTVKSTKASQNYQVLNSNLASSDSWIRDALLQGMITIEQASYKNSDNTILDEKNPFSMKLNGISWNTKIFTSCPDFIQRDDSSKLSKAEAQYQKRTAEINAKDEKFQRKLSLLNSEHQALQTEYDSVKSALDKNISRSFKTFNG